MKNIFTLLLLFVVFTSNAQFFPMNDIERYKGQEVEVMAFPEKELIIRYSNFYDKLGRSELVPFDSKNRLYPVRDNLYSDYSKLVGKKYRIVDVKKRYSSNYLLTLQDVVNNDIVYYDYNASHKGFNELVFKDISDYCDDKYYSSKEDKFENKKSVFAKTPENFGLTKAVDNNGVDYYLTLNVYFEKPYYDLKGFQILFENKDKWQKPEQSITINYDKNGKYKYNIFYRLSKEEFTYLQSNLITDIKLDFYTQEIDKSDAEAFKKIVNCIENK